MNILIRFTSTATLLVLMINSLVAQTELEKEKLLGEIADATCQCFQEKKSPELSAEAALGTCMIGYVEERREEYEALFGPLDYNNVEMMTRLGEKIGIKMMNFCPDAMMELGQQKVESIKEETKEKHYFLSGQITGVTGEEVAIISLRQLDGKPVKLHWLEYFPGSEMLADGKRPPTPVEVEYVNVDLYSPKTGEYMTRRKVVAMRGLE